MNLIQIKDLSFSYPTKKDTLKHINLIINKASFTCVVGENGSGKSTLMKTLLSLQNPMGGEIIFGDGLVANEIGYLPQQSTVKRDFPATNFEIVLSGNLGHSSFFYSSKDKELALKAMKRLRIDEFKDKCFRELSGGQQQRVLLARALCATQKVLLLDEPVSGLDPKVTAEMYELVKELNQNDKITIIMISHDLNDALKYATHILHVGSEIFFGTKTEYLNSELGKQFTSEIRNNIICEFCGKNITK